MLFNWQQLFCVPEDVKELRREGSLGQLRWYELYMLVRALVDESHRQQGQLTYQGEKELQHGPCTAGRDFGSR